MTEENHKHPVTRGSRVQSRSVIACWITEILNIGFLSDDETE